MPPASQHIRAMWPHEEDVELSLSSPRSAKSQRGIGLRARTSFPVLLCEGPHVAHCRAVELSPTGIVIERGRELSEREQRALFKLELYLPLSTKPVRVLARLVRCAGGNAYALKFVMVADVDRLSLMEHIDREQREAQRLLSELELEPQVA